MNSEKVKEIKKALECCNIDKNCTDCPYLKIGDCLKVFNADTLTLINELEKEIKENPSYAKGYADGIKNTYEVMLPQKLENLIERLKEKDLSVQLHKDFIIIDNKAIDETLKEFMGEKFDNEEEE